MCAFLTWIDAHQGLAAWAQAILSAGAIFAAYHFTRRQFADAQALQDREKHTENKRQISILLSVYDKLSKDAAAHATLIREGQRAEAITRGYNIQYYQRTHRHLAQIPIMSLPTATLASQMTEILGCIECFLHHAEPAFKIVYEDEQAVRLNYSPNPHQAGARHFIEKLHKFMPTAIATCNDYLNA